MNKQGINYDRSNQYNIDKTTNIRYGVIHQNDVPFWCELSEPFYHKTEAEKELEKIESLEDITEEQELRSKILREQIEEENQFIEPSSFIIDNSDYQAECVDNVDIFIMKSRFYTYAKFCSPCAPGACYLKDYTPVDEVTRDMDKCYCFGLEMFDDTFPCPYPIWEIATDKLIYEPKSL